MIRLGSLATPRDGVTWGGILLRVGQDRLHTVVKPAVAGYGGCRPHQAKRVNSAFAVGERLFMRLEHLKVVGGFGFWYKEHS